MPKKLSKDNVLIHKAYRQVKAAQTAHDLRLGLSILLLNEAGFTLKEAGQLLGKNSASISRYRVEFMGIGKGVPLPRKNWGGRRFGNLSPEKEKQLLLEFKDLAGEGRIVTASLIHTKYEQEVKKSVPLSTVTRMLERNQWRKIEPEPHHPKRDEAKENEFKKKSFKFPFKRRGATWVPPQ